MSNIELMFENRGIMIHAPEKLFILPAVNIQIWNENHELKWDEDHECWYGLYFEFGDEHRHYIVTQATNQDKCGLDISTGIFYVVEYDDLNTLDDISYVWLLKGEAELIKQLLAIKNAAKAAILVDSFPGYLMLDGFPLARWGIKRWWPVPET